MARRSRNPRKAAMQKMMREFLKKNISLKDGADVNSLMHEKISMLRPSPLKDQDEYPLDCSYEGRKSVDVRYISSSDNRGAGSVIGHQLRKHPCGTRFRTLKP